MIHEGSSVFCSQSVPRSVPRFVCFLTRDHQENAAFRGSSLDTLLCRRKHGLFRAQRACPGRALSDSNSSITYFDFSVFSVIWGVCFSLKANPNGMKTSDNGTLLAQGTSLLPGLNPTVK